MSGVNINCPFSTTLNAQGTGTLQIQTTGSYAFDGAPDMVFAIDVEPSSFATEFITIANTADNLQNPTFTLRDGAKDTLKTAVKTAVASDFTGVTANTFAPFNVSNNKLENYVANWAQNSIKATLESDGMAAFLTAEEIKDLALTDFNGSCDSTVDSLWTSLADKLPEVVYQYGNAVWLRGSGDSTDPTTIPFQENDSMTFRLNVAATFTISPDALAAPSGITSATPVSTLSYTLTGGPKKVNIVLNFKSSGIQTAAAAASTTTTTLKTETTETTETTVPK
jgi:hypothetical protein